MAGPGFGQDFYKYVLGSAESPMNDFLHLRQSDVGFPPLPPSPQDPFDALSRGYTPSASVGSQTPQQGTDWQITAPLIKKETPGGQAAPAGVTQVRPDQARAQTPRGMTHPAIRQQEMKMQRMSGAQGMGEAAMQRPTPEPADRGDRMGPAGPTQDPGKAQTILSAAQSEKGKRYAGPVIGEPDSMRWGDPGWDCSSFVSGMFKKVGVNLTPFTDAIATQTQKIDVSKEEPQAGDLVLFHGYEDGQRYPDGRPVLYKHVGIVMGPDQMIDASFRKGVSVQSISGLARSVGAQVQFRRVPGL